MTQFRTPGPSRRRPKLLARVDYPRAHWVLVAMRGQHVPSYLRDDAFQVGLMALVNADRRGFPPWQASVHLKRRLIDFVRQQTLRRETMGPPGAREVVWIPRGESPLDGVCFDGARYVAKDPPARVAAEYFPANWRERLTVRERLVIDRLYWGDTKSVELAAELGVTEGAIHQSKRNALAKLRRLMAPRPQLHVGRALAGG